MHSVMDLPLPLHIVCARCGGLTSGLVSSGPNEASNARRTSSPPNALASLPLLLLLDAACRC